MAELNTRVLVRTDRAGVHYGTLVEQSPDGRRVRLENCRRIWSWRGANTLNEIAVTGVGAGTKISVTAPAVDLTDVLEVLDVTSIAAKNLDTAVWAA